MTKLEFTDIEEDGRCPECGGELLDCGELFEADQARIFQCENCTEIVEISLAAAQI